MNSTPCMIIISTKNWNEKKSEWILVFWFVVAAAAWLSHEKKKYMWVEIFYRFHSRSLFAQSKIVLANAI